MRYLELNKKRVEPHICTLLLTSLLLLTFGCERSDEPSTRLQTAQQRPSTATVTSSSNSNPASPSPAPASARKGSLQIFLPDREFAEEAPEKRLSEAISEPVKPLPSNETSSSIIDEISRLKLKHDSEGETSIGYQFKKKSSAAQQADALREIDDEQPADDEGFGNGIEFLEKQIE